jgi:hypothetical protein
MPKNIKESWFSKISRGVRARRSSAEQDVPGNRQLCGVNRKGGDSMGKKVWTERFFKSTLVVLGWVSFIFGLSIEDPMMAIPFAVIARVLP